MRFLEPDLHIKEQEDHVPWLLGTRTIPAVVSVDRHCTRHRKRDAADTPTRVLIVPAGHPQLPNRTQQANGGAAAENSSHGPAGQLLQGLTEETPSAVMFGFGSVPHLKRLQNCALSSQGLQRFFSGGILVGF